MIHKKIKILLEEYQQFDSNESDIYDEKSYLSWIKESIEWRELSLREKHKKRRFVFSVIQKTGNAEEFVVETTVIELYELVEKVLDAIEKLPENYVSTRLVAMLTVFMFHVNEQRDTRQMSTTSFKLIGNILEHCINHKTFNPLNSELKTMIKLFNQLDELLTDTIL
ncbi:hypothetical protein [Aquimarina agarivorans]|uniref:hypothetical protein n=1 Tax=Aquimarina agarivorans TaxID=980584 RepID=UPI000248E612|nr:hypothetical protein [Aquimarina agarivorans]